jgi:RimJ/RimL family protein N-acetyltransferase
VATVRLEPLTASHLDDVTLLVADPDVQRFTRIPVPPPRGFAASWVKRYERGRRDGTREGFAIVDAATGIFLGLALVPEIDDAGRTAELGYVVAPAARGRGVAGEALRLLTRWAHSERGLHRLELRIGVANEASKRVAARCGYVREGLLRSVFLKQDIREDTEIWSRLPTDP